MTAGILRIRVRVHPRGHTAVGDFRVRFAAVDLWIVAPELLAGSRVEGKDDGAARRQVKPPFDEDRVGLERERFPVPLPQFPGSKAPGLFELVDILCV